MPPKSTASTLSAETGSEHQQVLDALSTIGLAPGTESADAIHLDLGADDGRGVELLAGQKPVVLTGAKDPQAMAKLLGVGLGVETAVYHPAKDGMAARLVFPLPKGEAEALEAKEFKIEKPADKPSEVAPSDQDEEDTPSTSESLGEFLQGALGEPLAEPSGWHVDPIPDGIPGIQIILEGRRSSYNPRLVTWYSKGKPEVVKGQTATVALALHLELYGSTKPENKFLRLTTYGSGFSTGRLKWDAARERGCFQDLMTVEMSPLQTPPGLVLLSSVPKTENNKATYTASSSLNVGLKKGEESAEGSVSYSIGASVSSTLSAFKAIDYSDGRSARWEWQMALCGDKANGTYDYRNPGSIIDFFGTVWDVVDLGKSTLFPGAQASWSMPLSYKGVLPFRMTAEHRLIYVATDLFTGMWSSSIRQVPVPFSVDFSKADF